MFRTVETDWISAYHPMESTLKVTNEFFVILQINQSLMKKSRFFGSPLVSYALVRVNKPNSKMQEIAPCNIAVTDTQK